MAVLLVAPEETELLIFNGAFLDGSNDELGEAVVVGFLLEFADAVHCNGHLRLVHAAEAQEVLRAVLLLLHGLIDEVLYGHAVLRGNGAVLQEEGAAVEVLGNE